MDRATVRREVERWTYAAARSVEERPSLAQKQAENARKLRLRFRVRPPYELTLFYCKKCKEFSPPPQYSTIRLRKGWLVIRCSKCGGVYRRKLKAAPTLRRTSKAKPVEPGQSAF